eukprot:472017_1
MLLFWMESYIEWNQVNGGWNTILYYVLALAFYLTKTHHNSLQNLSYRMASGGRLLWANVIPNTKRDDHEVLVLCCAIKQTISWHNERCGEQGYLSECLATEKRLYQKVAKELLSRWKSGKHKS